MILEKKHKVEWKEMQDWRGQQHKRTFFQWFSTKFLQTWPNIVQNSFNRSSMIFVQKHGD